MKSFLSLLVSLSLTLQAVAYTISGTVVDPSGEPLISASIRLMTAKDSTVVKGVVSDANGRFSLPNIKQGKFILEASYVGFENKYQDLNVNKNLKLGKIALAENAILLKETTVVGVRTPITVKEDTVEFNADSYKTQPNAVVEDLLKRLPGVEVGTDGSITANGKTVSKILIDGKEFFADDPKVASRNLPVNMVDKLQVVDRKSDLARITGVDDGEEETVINLTVKKGMNNGWFGTVEGGYGTDDRYKANFNVNHFWNGNQVTILGGANNVNDLGFTDGAGGRFTRFGGNNGITKSQAMGVNFNVGKEEIFRVGGNVLWSRSDRFTTEKSDRQYLFPNDSTSYQNSGKRTRDIGNNVRGDFRIQWKPDSSNTFDFRPNFSFNHANSNSSDSALTMAGDRARTLVTRSINDQSGRGNSWEFGGRLIYNHQFRNHPGRSMSAFVNYSFSDRREYNDTYSWNQFYLLNDSIDLYDQYSNNRTWSNNISARVSWTEPLGNVKNGNFLTVAYRFQYRWNNSDKLVYDHPVLFPDGWDMPPVIGEEEVFNEELSNQFRNDYMNQDIRAGFKHVTKKANLDVGMSLQPSRSKSINLINSAKNIPERWVWNFAPYLRYRWRPAKTKALQIDYNGRSSQPSMNQLQPVADMSNPLNITVGNPDLDPTFSHNLRLRFHNFNPEAARSIMTMLNASLVQNSIVSRTTYDPTTGGRVTTYENVNGVWNAMAMNMISFPFRNRFWTFNNHVMANYSQNVGFNNGQRNRSGSLMLEESFGLAFRPDNLEFELRPRYRLQNTTNSVQANNNRTVHNYGGSFYATYITPIGITLNTDLRFTATSGYSAGYDEKKWMWNASISYSFLRNQNATIMVRAYDLLRQNSNIRRNITANYIDDVATNSLGRYFMVTLSYKFNSFGKDKPEGSRDFDGPRHGPGRGPGGPPPGGGRPF